MDWQSAFNIALGVALFVSGGMTKGMWDALTSLRTDMADLAAVVNANRWHLLRIPQRF